jgi:hypothetical protein
MSNAIPSLNKEWMRISFAIAVGLVIIIILFILDSKTESRRWKTDLISLTTAMRQVCFLKSIFSFSSYKSLSAFEFFSDFSFIPFLLATSRISCDIFIEQNLGPHIEQNGLLLPLQLEVFHHEIL